EVAFQATVVGDGCNEGNTTFTWDFGDGDLGSGASVAHTYAKPGSYAVSVRADCEYGCAGKTASTSVEVTCPDVSITGRDPDVETLCPGCSVQFTATTDPPNQRVHWGVEPLGSGVVATISDQGLLRVPSTS